MQVIFYKSKEHKNFYLIYKGGNGENPQRMLQKITHTGEYTDSGYGHLEIEFGFAFNTETADNFIDFLVEQVSTNHIENSEYDNTSFRSWYEFKDVSQPEK